MRGAAPMKVGFTDAQVVDDLVDATVDRGSEAARHLGRHQDLAERVRHRQPAGTAGRSREDVLDPDGLALVDPRRVAQPHALGAAGRAGGVDQGRELVGRDRRGRLGDDVGVLGELGRAQRGQVVERDDPVAVGACAVEGDDLDQVRQLGAVRRRAWRPARRPRRRRRGTRSQRGCTPCPRRWCSGRPSWSRPRRTSRRGRPGSTRSACWTRCRRAARTPGPGRAGRPRGPRPGRRPASR